MTTAVWQFIKDHGMGPTPLDGLEPPERTVVDGLTILASRKPIPSTVRVPAPLVTLPEIKPSVDELVAEYVMYRQARERALEKARKAPRKRPPDFLGPLVARRTRRRTK
mgnify:FL=1